MAGIGVYPGSFNPPTRAHLAIATACRERFELERIDLVVSTVDLAKTDVVHPRFEDRVAVIEAAAAEHEWLTVVTTNDQFLVDIARGYDRLILGTDKWHQIHEVHWYGSEAERDAAIDALPPVALVPRPGTAGKTDGDLAEAGHNATGSVIVVEVPDVGHISSTRARDGELDLMVPAAADFARRTGAWIDVDRYESGR